MPRNTCATRPLNWCSIMRARCHFSIRLNGLSVSALNRRTSRRMRNTYLMRTLRHQLCCLVSDLCLVAGVFYPVWRQFTSQTSARRACCAVFPCTSSRWVPRLGSSSQIQDACPNWWTRNCHFCPRFAWRQPRSPVIAAERLGAPSSPIGESATPAVEASDRVATECLQEKCSNVHRERRAGTPSGRQAGGPRNSASRRDRFPIRSRAIHVSAKSRDCPCGDARCALCAVDVFLCQSHVGTDRPGEVVSTTVGTRGGLPVSSVWCTVPDAIHRFS